MKQRIYRSNIPEMWFRIGKTLLRIQFVGGLYATDNALVQQAIENSPAYLAGKITAV